MGYYKQCSDCGKYVNLAKPILGSLHICLLPEEIITKREAQQLMNTQLNFQAGTANILRRYSQAYKVMTKVKK